MSDCALCDIKNCDRGDLCGRRVNTEQSKELNPIHLLVAQLVTEAQKKPMFYSSRQPYIKRIEALILQSNKDLLGELLKKKANPYKDLPVYSRIYQSEDFVPIQVINQMLEGLGGRTNGRPPGSVGEKKRYRPQEDAK